MCLLHGKVAMVTGAGRGIGRSIALELARAGSKVTVAARTLAQLQEVAADIEALGVEALVCPMDVSVANQVEQTVARTIQQFGRLDILVNNAGVVYVGHVETMSEEDWDRIIATNLKSVFLCCRAVIKLMRQHRWGRIINIGSLAARNGGVVTGANYAASKGGVWSFTKSLAKELAPSGITVNYLALGGIDTPMTQGHSQESMINFVKAVPLGRLGRPEEVAKAVLFLASDPAAYITGATLDINGGIRMD